jgi:hypothetical protein
VWTSCKRFARNDFRGAPNARANLILRRRVDEDVKRRQLTVLRYTNVSASKPLRVIVRSIRPTKATDAVHRLSRPTDRERNRHDSGLWGRWLCIVGMSGDHANPSVNSRRMQLQNALFGVAYRERQRFSVPQLGYLGYQISGRTRTSVSRRRCSRPPKPKTPDGGFKHAGLPHAK